MLKSAIAAVISIAACNQAQAVVFQQSGSIDGPYGPGLEIISDTANIFQEIGAGAYQVQVQANRAVTGVAGNYELRRSYVEYDNDGNVLDSNANDTGESMSFARTGVLSWLGSFEIPQGQTLPTARGYQVVTWKLLSGSVEMDFDNSGMINWIVTINAVPEPASWALMIAGFGLAGAATRQRRAALVSNA